MVIEQGVDDQRLDQDEPEDEEEADGRRGAGLREMPSQAAGMALAWQKAPAAAARVMRPR